MNLTTVVRGQVIRKLALGHNLPAQRDLEVGRTLETLVHRPAMWVHHSDLDPRRPSETDRFFEVRVVRDDDRLRDRPDGCVVNEVDPEVHVGALLLVDHHPSAGCRFGASTHLISPQHPVHPDRSKPRREKLDRVEPTIGKGAPLHVGSEVAEVNVDLRECAECPEVHLLTFTGSVTGEPVDDACGEVPDDIDLIVRGEPTGELLLVDEVLTPDSSRYWPLDGYAPGRDQPSFDKQFVRNHLLDLVAKGLWNKEAPGPELPAAVVAATLDRYREALARLDLPTFAGTEAGR